jgi:hypothetical protein
MALLAPPPSPPRVALGDNDDVRRVRMRLTQVIATTVTILVTAWLCTLGPIPAILGLLVAKHILVAILVMGLGVDAAEPWRQPCDIRLEEPIPPPIDYADN